MESTKGKLRADRKKAKGSERGRKKSGIRSGTSEREETEVADEMKIEQKRANEYPTMLLLLYVDHHQRRHHPGSRRFQKSSTVSFSFFKFQSFSSD